MPQRFCHSRRRGRRTHTCSAAWSSRFSWAFISLYESFLCPVNERRPGGAAGDRSYGATDPATSTRCDPASGPVARTPPDGGLSIPARTRLAARGLPYPTSAGESAVPSASIATALSVWKRPVPQHHRAAPLRAKHPARSVAVEPGTGSRRPARTRRTPRTIRASSRRPSEAARRPGRTRSATARGRRRRSAKRTARKCRSCFGTRWQPPSIGSPSRTRDGAVQWAVLPALPGAAPRHGSD